ncbi:MAG: nodulation protein NfeD [Halioglobus sp.]|nr:nodulation protein NfeD [Halioglobus sp.]
MRSVCYTLLLLLSISCLLVGRAHADVWVIDIEGAIGPATADHMARGMAQAAKADAAVVVLRIDTPGGLDSAMRDMIKSVLASTIPVVAYVAPSGARAASAGTYLLYATHLAAMAPGTNLGAATPVQIGGPGLPGLGGKPDKTGEEEPGLAKGQPASAMEKKMVNDAVAYIQSLAAMRNRNAEWAELAVREGASLSAEAALQNGVIEIVAPSMQDLLLQMDGREVMVNETPHVLRTAGLAIHTYAMNWRSEFLGVITDPNIAYILMLVGIYGLIIEFYNPGIGLPGILGGICLLVALYALQALPISYAGLGLVLLGITLMAAEAFSPSFGLFGLGGLTAFTVGSILLMDTDVPAFQIAIPLILGVAAFSGGLLIFVMGAVMRARQRPVVTGMDRLRGECAEVETVEGGRPRVRLDGELWAVACDESLTPRDTVRVDAIDGLTLRVSKQSKEG